MPRGKRCEDPTHVRRTKRNACWECLTRAQRAYAEKKRAAQFAGILIPAHSTVKAEMTRASWAVRKAVYGPSGFKERHHRTRASYIAAGLRMRRTHCKRGHPLSGSNLRSTARADGRTQRRCRACTRLLASGTATARPSWATTREGVRVCIETHDAWCLTRAAQLWADVFASHPDRGGNAARFRDARRRWDAFMAAEVEWYRIAGVALPQGMKRTSAAA